MNKKKRLVKAPKLTLLMVIVLTMVFGSSASAFNDIKGDKEQKAIERLEQRGFIKGDLNGRFHPFEKMNGAAAVTLIVNALDLNIDNIDYVKEPKASDYFTHVKDNVWYSQAFVIAAVNQLDISKDIKPSSPVTKEQFTHWLFKALNTKGEFAWTLQYTEIADNEQINPDYASSIQTMLNGGIISLDKDQKFNPTQSVTRSEAVGMVYRTLEFIENIQTIEPAPVNLYDPSLKTEAVSKEITKVTISGMAPHPGYALEIASVEYSKGTALVHCRVLPPDPDMVYPQVISEVTAVTYIPAGYKAELGTVSE
ncbi:S-layer homology domain-containing protein [Paenibacillus sanguinis]|uniref:S-layer homology domain-containing protein n=1 Tax=Paenibacillus sanguinis TaxID=225906 RepID=UPI00036E102E|nr:S-layer homology domain-containing protein [Paenibacillus sanguinis]